jgi:hypothetical protein
MLVDDVLLTLLLDGVGSSRISCLQLRTPIQIPVQSLTTRQHLHSTLRRYYVLGVSRLHFGPGQAVYESSEYLSVIRFGQVL